ncbi:MAG: chemotaxis protein CheW, partial [Gemmatimonadaceae bacterium]
DAVLEVASFDESRLSPPPPLFRGLAGEYLRGIVRLDDRLLIYLDVDRLLSSDERLTLERTTEESIPHG